jgi:protein-tyrosine phosphatase
MSSESRMSSSAEGQGEEKESSSTDSQQVQIEQEVQQEETRPYLKFSPVHWASTGIVRLLYRYWTRIAVAVFPENSAGERLAKRWHIPLPDELNLSWVTPHLAVGGRVHSDDIASLARLGVTQVVDTRSEYSDDSEEMKREGIELLYLPTPDTYPLSIGQLEEGAAWISERLKQGGRVLIHCEHGVGRSVLLTCAVLVYDGMHARDALELVQEKRWQAGPNQRQVARLKEFESSVRSRRRA